MSLLRSPNKSGSGSQPDLTKLRECATFMEKSQPLTRKRKERDPDFDIKQEFNKFRDEMRSFLVSFADIQKENMYKLEKDMSDIKNQLSDIKLSTNNVIEEQNRMRSELDQLKNLCSANENSIKYLQTINSESKESSSSQSCLFSPSSYEKVLNECHDRIMRRKNILIIGIPEPTVENKNDRLVSDKKEVLKVINLLCTDCPMPSKIFRIGKYLTGKNRPIKVCFESDQIAKNLLRNRGNIKTEIKIFSDQTPSQQNCFKVLKEELRKRQQSGENNLVIKYIKGTPKIIAQQPKN